MEGFERVKELLTKNFGEEIVIHIALNADPTTITIPATHVREVCLELHENEDTFMDMLSCISGLDNGPETGTMEVIYHLYSIPYDLRIALKVELPRNQEDEPGPEVDSVSGIWKTALWLEREVYDLFGIQFRGHPDLRRILLPADWKGHPLRKDYQHQEYYHGIKVEY